MNWANPDVRQALYDITNFWIDKGVGGFRIDAIPYIKKPLKEISRRSLPTMRRFLHTKESSLATTKTIELAAQANDIPIWIIPDWNIVFAVYFHKNWPFSIFANILSIKCSNKKRNTYV